ncbi:hypothetical protein [Neopusillimonas maritima]|uniref:Uncharacterized protein n=1 Tax=Neopusillimonas maritima TaxID=2026239 RepID=A0A3A1YWH3_9BURK|nr:hypothetical protein [Neopusillimonas maritima]RIY42552.1 hypothetical protein CJP73_03755 [Neopusillimonas maritima]
MATTDEVKNHAIWAAIAQTTNHKGNAVLADSAANAQAFELVQQIFDFASVVERRIQQTPASLIGRPALNQLQQILSGAAGEIENYINNKNIAHLTNALNLVETKGILNLAQIPVITDGDVGKITDDLSAQVQGILRSALEERDRLKKDSKVLSGQFTALSEQIQKLTETVAQQSAEAKNVIQEVKTLYAAKEQGFSKSFDSAIEAQAKEHTLQLTKLQNEAKSAQEANAKSAQDLIAEMTEDRDRAKKILRIIGNIGVTGQYGETAKIESQSANFWRWATIIIFGVSIGVGIWALTTANDVDIRLAVARLFFAILILGATIYTGRESARHRTNSDRAKRVELELASLGPFMESLTPEQQQNLRVKLTDQYFGKEVDPHNIKTDVSTKDLVDLLKKAIDK